MCLINVKIYLIKTHVIIYLDINVKFIYFKTYYNGHTYFKIYYNQSIQNKNYTNLKYTLKQIPKQKKINILPRTQHEFFPSL